MHAIPDSQGNLFVSEKMSVRGKREQRSRWLVRILNALAVAFLAGGLVHAQGREALYIDESGKVGIGTSQPAEALDVKGTAKAQRLKVDGTADFGAGVTIQGPLTITGPGTLTIPAGTTEQREASPGNGALRYNTTAKIVEVYVEGIWSVVETTPYRRGNAQVFNYSGGDQAFVVPPGVDRIFVKTWGAGGAGGTPGGWSYGSDGGGGGFTQGMLTVAPGESLTVIVGGGGEVNQGEPGYGGGGPVSKNNVDNRYSGGGGGRSAVERKGAVPLIVAGGGGGGGSTRSPLMGGKGNSGGAGGGLTGENGYSQYDKKPLYSGRGGGQDAVGAGGAVNGGPGIGSAGGTVAVNSYGGGGGGGWKGGGSGAYSEPNTMAGGGGGSGHLEPAALFAVTRTGARRQTPMQSDADYVPGIGIGGNPNENGGHGLVVIRW